MPSIPSGFKNFEFTEDQKLTLSSDFKPLIKGSSLTRCAQTAQVIADYKQKPAIYFWVMRYENQMFRIYIGKTSSMSYRVDNYISEYQPHSPNDFKIRIFHGFMTEFVLGGMLDLYFLDTDLDNLTLKENESIKLYTPLLNHQGKPSPEAKEKLRDSYVAYYRSSFQRMLLPDE